MRRSLLEIAIRTIHVLVSALHAIVKDTDCSWPSSLLKKAHDL